MKFAQELPTKRERTEVSASFKLGSAGAVGRHTKTSENLIQMVSAARAAACDHPTNREATKCVSTPNSNPNAATSV